MQFLDSAGALEKQEDFTHSRDSTFFSTHTLYLPQLCMLVVWSVNGDATVE